MSNVETITYEVTVLADDLKEAWQEWSDEALTSFASDGFPSAHELLNSEMRASARAELVRRGIEL